MGFPIFREEGIQKVRQRTGLNSCMKRGQDQEIFRLLQERWPIADSLWPLALASITAEFPLFNIEDRESGRVAFAKASATRGDKKRLQLYDGFAKQKLPLLISFM